MTQGGEVGTQGNGGEHNTRRGDGIQEVEMGHKGGGGDTRGGVGHTGGDGTQGAWGTKDRHTRGWGHKGDTRGTQWGQGGHTHGGSEWGNLNLPGYNSRPSLTGGMGWWHPEGPGQAGEVEPCRQKWVWMFCVWVHFTLF